MARESAKRATSRRASRATGNRPRSRKPASDPPSDTGRVDRAPGRGKYDRSATADSREREQLRRLLDASAHVFAEKGWAGATVEAIVTRAGMSRRTFYEHFDDLRECLLVLHQKVTKASFRAVESQVQAVDAPPEMLRNGITALLGGIAMFPHVARVMFREVRAAGPEFEKIHEAMMARFAKLVFDGVQKSYDRGLAKIPPDELRVFALVSAMEAVGMRFVMRGEESKALEAAPILIDMVQRTFDGAVFSSQ
jgi:AcrR family transcriptional regulator